MKTFSIAFILIALFFFSSCSSETEKQTKLENKSVVSKEINNNENKIEDGKIICYYFHSNYRCASCKKIESWYREAVESGFGERIKDSSLIIIPINVDQKANKHFIKEYKLYTKSVVLAKADKSGKIEWKNLDKIWEKLAKKEDFVSYIQEELKAFINK